MKTFKLIMVFVGIFINIAFYFAFFVSFFNKSVGDTDALLMLIAAMVMTMLIKQELKNI